MGGSKAVGKYFAEGKMENEKASAVVGGEEFSEVMHQVITGYLAKEGLTKTLKAFLSETKKGADSTDETIDLKAVIIAHLRDSSEKKTTAKKEANRTSPAGISEIEVSDGKEDGQRRSKRSAGKSVEDSDEADDDVQKKDEAEAGAGKKKDKKEEKRKGKVKQGRGEGEVKNKSKEGEFKEGQDEGKEGKVREEKGKKEKKGNKKKNVPEKEEEKEGGWIGLEKKEILTSGKDEKVEEMEKVTSKEEDNSGREEKKEKKELKKEKARKKKKEMENDDKKGDVKKAKEDKKTRKRKHGEDEKGEEEVGAKNDAVKRRKGGNGERVEEEMNVVDENVAKKGEAGDKEAEEKMEGTEKQPSTLRAFQRVKVDEVVFKDPRLVDNSYWAKGGAQSGWGAKAQEVLGQVRGKGFRHEKTKKKRGSYRGGQIDLASHSIKFADSEDE